ncbi:MAG: hypothetical protein WA865_14005, partial [Spirulinaceae cyanobacterium]
MSSSLDTSSGSNKLLTSQNIIYAGITWSVLALISFILFALIPSEQDSPTIYLIDTYILECLPFLGAALLCFRNANSPKIASGRNVWLGIGLGTLSYFTANLIFGWWELYWELDPDVSPADLFYVAFYLLLSWGMILAILPRRLNLERWQWLVLGSIAVVGTALAVWIAIAPPPLEELEAIANNQPVTAQTEAVSSPSQALEEEIEAIATHEAPQWVMSLEDTLSPLARPINFFYIIGDLALVIIATTLLLAYWGGAYSWSWRMIGAATFALYIAD